MGWTNTRFFRLPVGVAMLLAGVLAGAALLAAQTLIGPFWGFDDVQAVVGKLNFSATVLNDLLAFLLFAAGMQVDLHELRRRTWAVWTLATLGVAVSTLLVGFGLHGVSRLFGGAVLPLGWALVFGALISPTDPVAVTAALGGHGKRLISRPLGAVLQGESLFNDGVGLVVFTAVLGFAASGAPPHPVEAVVQVVLEAGGGLLVGWALSWVAVFALRAIDDYVVEMIITVATAVCTYSVARTLHVSGPIAAAAAGIVVGHYGSRTAFSDQTRRYVEGFWELVDESLNALLFLLTGLQVFVVAFRPEQAPLMLAAAVLVIASRLLVVLPWGAYFRLRHEERGASVILAWGGLRGALSLALALTLPPGPERPLLLSLTFFTVVASVVGQGLSFTPLLKRLGAAHGGGDESTLAPAKTSGS